MEVSAGPSGRYTDGWPQGHTSSGGPATQHSAVLGLSNVLSSPFLVFGDKTYFHKKTNPEFVLCVFPEVPDLQPDKCSVYIFMIGALTSVGKYQKEI